MTTGPFTRDFHNSIFDVLGCFDAEYFNEHNILFGGGTRIVLEVNEYRQSIDIDFLCPTTESYRAVRSVVTSNDFGPLTSIPLSLKREIVADRYGVRAAVEHGTYTIKVEFVAMDGYRLGKAKLKDIKLPVIDQAGCYSTKLLALTDRYGEPSKKDLLDLLAMRLYWGPIPQESWLEAERHYGQAPKNRLLTELELLPTQHQQLMKNLIGMHPMQCADLLAMGARWDVGLEYSQAFSNSALIHGHLPR